MFIVFKYIIVFVFNMFFTIQEVGVYVDVRMCKYIIDEFQFIYFLYKSVELLTVASSVTN